MILGFLKVFIIGFGEIFLIPIIFDKILLCPQKILLLLFFTLISKSEIFSQNAFGIELIKFIKTMLFSQQKYEDL